MQAAQMHRKAMIFGICERVCKLQLAKVLGNTED
jgi:hypothetical protein